MANCENELSYSSAQLKDSWNARSYHIKKKKLNLTDTLEIIQSGHK